MRSNTLAIPAMAVALSACLNSNEPGTPRDYGFLLLETTPTAEVFQTEASGVFYRTTGRVTLPSTEAQNDSCVRRPGFPADPVGLLPPTISAGPSLQLTLSGTEMNLDMNVSDFAITYAPAVEAFESVPGDVATLVIPGDPDGFPNLVIAGKTAEPFAVDPVPTYSSPTPITFEWTPAEEAGSRMSITLRYVVGQGVGQPEHVYCELEDDGTHTLPADWVDGFRAAGFKEAIFRRDRITTLIEGGATMLLSSSLEVEAETPDLSAASSAPAGREQLPR